MRIPYIWILLAVIAGLSVKPAPPKTWPYNPKGGPLSISGLTLGTRRAQIESSWIRKEDWISEGYQSYSRDRQWIHAHFDSDGLLESIVGYRLEQDGHVITGAGFGKPQVFRAFHQTPQIDDRLQFPFVGGSVTVLFTTTASERLFACHSTVFLPPEKGRVGRVVLGRLPEPFQPRG